MILVILEATTVLFKRPSSSETKMFDLLHGAFEIYA